MTRLVYQNIYLENNCIDSDFSTMLIKLLILFYLNVVLKHMVYKEDSDRRPVSNRRPILISMPISHFITSTSIDAVYPHPNQNIGHRYDNLERTPI